MSTTVSVSDLLGGLRGRACALRLLETLGIGLDPVEVPPEAWASYGLGEAPGNARLWAAGRSGSLDALLFELSDADEARATSLARRIRARNPACLYLLAFAAPDYRTLTLGVFSLEGAFLHLVLEPGAAKSADIETLEEMVPRAGEQGLALVLRYARALDRGRVTTRFFGEFRARRAAIAAAWAGVPPEAEKERSQLALLFLCRLTFLYFVQARGALAGDPHYLAALFGRWVTGAERAGSFYRRRIMPLFFGALNRRPADRGEEARALGDLPYLNGGLFEPHALERRFPALDLPDDEVRLALDGLLERYRFTTSEGEDEASGGGIDPEILGRVFEGLMAPDQRTGTGTYYTPAPVVRRVVREALQVYLADSCGPDVAAAVVDGAASAVAPDVARRASARLERVRVLDPACGSGAFLLGALGRLARALEGLGREPGEVRREVVARSLHGVDLLDDAALLCSLRLWLALSAPDREIRPLPNLDRRIRQGDALVDPLDLAAAADARSGDEGAGFHPLRDPQTRAALRSIDPASRRYLDSGPEDRDRLRSALAEAERTLAAAWIDGARRVERGRIRSIDARAADRDLFGEPTADARRAASARPAAVARLGELGGLADALEEDGALPFFSFGVHFADAAAGFDLIVSNPPWIRAHRWPERLRSIAATRFEVCRDAGWPAGARLAGTPAGAGAQVDLALLFLERAIRLLAPGGVLAMLLPTKTMRALYGGGARALMLRELELAAIEDHSLDQRSIFRADAFAAVVIGRKPGEASGGSGSDVASRQVRVRLERRSGPAAEFRVAQRDLPLLPDDPASPWVLAPPDVLPAIRAMQRAGPPLGRHADLRVRRGVMTGANDVLLIRRAELKLGGLARIEAEGHRRARRDGRTAAAAGRFRAWVEAAGLRPLVRGAGIAAFAYRTDGYVVWDHAGATGVAGPASPPATPRLQRYLQRHRRVLEGRPGWRPALPLGALFRLTGDTLRPKVAWHDLSDTLKAVALPRVVALDGHDVELIPLNTVYFIPVQGDDVAVLLAGLLNSLPARVFARAVAERAKDARFRFFGWTLSCLPLPPDWRSSPQSAGIAAVSAAAHSAGGISPDRQNDLDRLVAALYGIDAAGLHALQRFDAWLKGES